MKRFINHFTKHLFLLVMILSLCIPSYAEELMPRWDNASVIDAELVIVNGKAECNVIVAGKSGTTAIKGVLKITDITANQDYFFSVPKTNAIAINKTFSVNAISNHQYRGHFAGTITRNGVDEDVSCSTSIVRCP